MENIDKKYLESLVNGFDTLSTKIVNKFKNVNNMCVLSFKKNLRDKLKWIEDDDIELYIFENDKGESILIAKKKK